MACNERWRCCGDSIMPWLIKRDDGMVEMMSWAMACWENSFLVLLANPFCHLLFLTRFKLSLSSCCISRLGKVGCVRQTVCNCKLIKKTPTIPCRGPMEAGNLVGMSLALDMLVSVLIGKPRIKGEDHIRFDSIQKIQGTFTTAWESYPRGIQQGSSISSGLKKHLSCNVPLNRIGLAYS